MNTEHQQTHEIGKFNWIFMILRNQSQTKLIIYIFNLENSRSLSSRCPVSTNMNNSGINQMNKLHNIVKTPAKQQRDSSLGKYTQIIFSLFLFS